MNLGRLNPVDLAFLGDGFYELNVRRLMLERGWTGSDRLHRETVRYVCAENQAYAIKTLLPGLTPEEQDLCRRTRNRKSATKPRNADPVDYKWATALEALIGWLVLSDDAPRAEALILQAVSAIDKKEPK